MSIITRIIPWAGRAILVAALASLAAVPRLSGQQVPASGPAAAPSAAAPAAPAVSTPAAAPAPHASVLRDRSDDGAPTLAAAQAEHARAARASDNHTIVVSTLVLVLAVVILVLLIK